MNCVKVHRNINQIMSLYYRVGLWHQGDEPTVKETGLKIFFFIYHVLFSVSLFAGAIEIDNKVESIFLIQMAIISGVLSLKLFYIISKKKQIVELLNRICVYVVDDREEFILVNDTLKSFMKIGNFLFFTTNFAGLCAVLVVPFLGSEKKLFFNIGFILDWRNNEIAYWLALSFSFSQVVLTIIAFSFSAIIWYLMINSGLKFDILGNQIKRISIENIDEATEGKISKFGKDIFLGRLIEAIQFNHRIREEIHQMQSFLSPVFLAQLATSGICTCFSIYSLIFSDRENLIEYMIALVILFYNLFEIFMVMYFGNEIKLSSDRLTYCLFESNWIDQSQSSKKLLIIFGEIIKQPYVMVVGKIYPLTLEIFTRIMNFAYSMFNVLKNGLAARI